MLCDCPKPAEDGYVRNRGRIIFLWVLRDSESRATLKAEQTNKMTHIHTHKQWHCNKILDGMIMLLVQLVKNDCFCFVAMAESPQCNSKTLIHVDAWMQLPLVWKYAGVGKTKERNANNKDWMAILNGFSARAWIFADFYLPFGGILYTFISCFIDSFTQETNQKQFAQFNFLAGFRQVFCVFFHVLYICIWYTVEPSSFKLCEIQMFSCAIVCSM